MTAWNAVSLIDLSFSVRLIHMQPNRCASISQNRAATHTDLLIPLLIGFAKPALVNLA